MSVTINDLNPMNHQKWSQAASLEVKKEIIAHTFQKKKRIDRAKIIFRD